MHVVKVLALLPLDFSVVMERSLIVEESGGYSNENGDLMPDCCIFVHDDFMPV